MSNENRKYLLFTHKQGQYLAYIFYYSKINCRAPSQADLQNYFQVTPPTVHQMIFQLEKKGLLKRQKNKARAIEVMIPKDAIPELD